MTIKERINKTYPIKTKKDVRYANNLEKNAYSFADELDEKYEHTKLSKATYNSLKNKIVNLFIDYDNIFKNNKKTEKVKTVYDRLKKDSLFCVFEDEASRIDRYCYSGTKGVRSYYCLKLSLIDKVEEELNSKIVDLIPRYHSHQSKRLNFLKSPNDKKNEKRFFGLELETVGKNENVLEVEDYTDLFSPEEDGSLNGEGFEMVSEPMTLLYIKENKKRITSMLKNLTSAGQKADESCGFHIHVSRNAFKNKESIEKAVRLVGGMKKNFEIFARRKENKDYYEYRGQDSLNFLWFDCKKENDYACDRYSAVNLTNVNTIEFRIFAGTLDYECIVASIELINNIIDFANSNKSTILAKDLFNTPTIIKYLKRNKLKVDNRETLNVKESSEKENHQTISDIVERLDDFTGTSWNIVYDKANKTMIASNQKNTGYIEFKNNNSIYHFDNNQSEKVNIVDILHDEKVDRINIEDAIFKNALNFFELNKDLSDKKKIKKCTYKNYSTLKLIRA